MRLRHYYIGRSTIGVQSAEEKNWLKRSMEESVVALSAVFGSITGAAGHLGEADPRHLVGVV